MTVHHARANRSARLGDHCRALTCRDTNGENMTFPMPPMHDVPGTAALVGLLALFALFLVLDHHPEVLLTPLIR